MEAEDPGCPLGAPSPVWGQRSKKLPRVDRDLCAESEGHAGISRRAVPGRELQVGASDHAEARLCEGARVRPDPVCDAGTPGGAQASEPPDTAS